MAKTKKSDCIPGMYRELVEALVYIIRESIKIPKREKELQETIDNGIRILQLHNFNCHSLLYPEE